MADKYEPSKEFTDQAWLEMKALLDKNMPDKGAIIITPDQGKRNNFLLLWPLLLLFFAAGMFFYYQSNRGLSDDLSVQENSATELGIVSIEKEVDVIDVEANNAVILSENLKETLAENTNLPLIDNVKIDAKTNIASSKSFNESLISKSNNNTSKTPFIIQNEVQKGNIILGKENLEREKAEIISPFIFEAENLESIKKEENPPIALIKALDSKVLAFLTLTGEEKKLDEFMDVKKAKNRLPIFAFAGVRNYEFSDNINFTAGLETVFRKQEKKIGLRTGFNYAQRSTTYLTKEERIAQVGFDDAADFELITNSSTASFYEARAELNSNPIRYHFLEIPIFLDYKISKNWSLHGGIAAKTLLFSSTQNFGLLNESENRNENLTTEDTSYFTPRSFNFGASIGFNFRATQRLGLQARFSHNLLDIYPELPEKQRSNSIELGLSWRLK